MKKSVVLFLMLVAMGASALADTVITRAGASYSGQFLGAPGGTIGFTDTSGIRYSFPIRDVQSLVFTASNDAITLRNGKVYSGKFGGSDPLAFKTTSASCTNFRRKTLNRWCSAVPNSPRR
jgi:hypothetical protein